MPLPPYQSYARIVPDELRETGEETNADRLMALLSSIREAAEYAPGVTGFLASVPELYNEINQGNYGDALLMGITGGLGTLGKGLRVAGKMGDAIKPMSGMADTLYKRRNAFEEACMLAQKKKAAKEAIDALDDDAVIVEISENARKMLKKTKL